MFDYCFTTIGQFINCNVCIGCIQNTLFKCLKIYFNKRKKIIYVLIFIISVCCIKFTNNISSHFLILYERKTNKKVYSSLILWNFWNKRDLYRDMRKTILKLCTSVTLMLFQEYIFIMELKTLMMCVILKKKIAKCLLLKLIIQ